MHRIKYSLLTILVTSFFIFPVNGIEYSEREGCSPFQNYDEFIEFLSSKNFFTPSLFFKWKFPRENFNAFQQETTCSIINYQMESALVTGYFLKPNNWQAERLPLIVFNRGGNGSFGALNFVTLMEYLKPLVDQGFAVIASQYRGHRRKQPELYGKDEFGGQDVSDVHALIEIAKTKKEVDTNNIFMYGVSRGGMMSYMVSRARSDIKAMVIHAGVTDLQQELEFRPEMENVYRALIPNYTENAAQQLMQRSVMHWVEELPDNLPILLVHGAEDERVSVQNSIQLHATLTALNRPVELSIYPHEGHMFTDKARQLEEVTQWFKSHIRIN